jgi:hypothetical protein
MLSGGNGNNVRLFKAGVTSPSALDETLEKGGKWAIAVSKHLSKEMFEELCLYVMDERLGYMADGCVLAVRDVADVLQVWTRSQPKPDDVNKMARDITRLLGLAAAGVHTPVFEFHDNAYKKASKAKTYFLVEPAPLGPYVDAQETALQPRTKNSTSAAERKEKKDRKKKGNKNSEDFLTVGGNRKKTTQNRSDDAEENSHETSTNTSTNTSSNPYGNLSVEQDEGAKKKASNQEPAVDLPFKTFNTRKKAPSKKGSKSNKGKAKDEFANLPPAPGNVVPLPVFMGGAIAVLLLAIILWYNSNQSTA